MKVIDVMSDVYQGTASYVDSWVREVALNLDRNMYLGVFGDHSVARYVASILLELGFDKLVFIANTCLESHLDNIPVINSDRLSVEKVEGVLLCSMSNPAKQDMILKSSGVKIPTWGIKHGRTLCTEPRFNPVSPSQIQDLKNKYSQDVFFVIGNGPSLNITPPEKISGGVKLAGNGIILKEKFQPDYYFMLDYVCMKSWPELIAQLSCPIIASAHLFEDVTNAHYEGKMNNYKNIVFHQVTNAPRSEYLDILKHGAFTGDTIICTMIQFGVHMGAKKIVILGVDNNYSKLEEGKHHFCEDYHEEVFLPFGKDVAQDWEKRHRSGIEKAIAQAERMGVTVVDATPVNNNLTVKKVQFKTFCDPKSFSHPLVEEGAEYQIQGSRPSPANPD